MPYQIKRGQLWFCKSDRAFDPTSSCQSGNRPVIVVSNEWCNKYSDVLIVVPCTTRVKKNMPTHLIFSSSDMHTTALAEQITAVDKKNLVTCIMTLPDWLMEHLDKCVSIAVGLTIPFGGAKIPDDGQGLNISVPIIVGAMDKKEKGALTYVQKEAQEKMTTDFPTVKDGSKHKWTIPKMQMFVNHYEQFTLEKMADVYNLSDAVIKKYYKQFKLNISENNKRIKK